MTIKLEEAPSRQLTKTSAKMRVYLVDDHILFRRGLAAVINFESDMEVCGETDDCAIATSEIIRLQPDAVVTDLILLGNNGLELIKNLRVMAPSIRVVVLSGYTDPNYAIRAIKAGASAFVSKREESHSILGSLRGQSYGSPEIERRLNSELFDSIRLGTKFSEDSPVAELSDRELEVVTLIGSGLETREIALRLKMSEKTVASHRRNIKTKLRLRSPVQVVHFCTRWVHENHLGPV